MMAGWKLMFFVNPTVMTAYQVTDAGGLLTYRLLKSKIIEQYDKIVHDLHFTDHVS